MDPTGVLSDAVRIDNQNAHSIFNHDLAVAANGIAGAVWQYQSDTSVIDIWQAILR